MYHSLIIGDKNTYDDWHIVPESRPKITPPSVKEEYIEIPGSSNAIDISEVIDGENHIINYSDCEGSFDFLVLNGYQPWHVLKAQISNYLHGKTHKLILEDDPEYYYIGRFKLNDWRSEKDWSRIAIDYRVAPFKYSVSPVTHNDIRVVGMKTVNFPGLATTTILEVQTTDNLTAQYNGHTYALKKGIANYIPLTGVDKPNVVNFYGSGRLTIQYRRGSL